MCNHGGKREGSGRKPLPDGEKKVARTFKLSPAIIEYLSECDNATATIEAAIQRSKPFRDWKTA